MNSFSMKANKLSIKKRDLKMSHRDALTVEPQRNSSKEVVAATAEAVVAEIEAATKVMVAVVTGGKLKEGKCSPF